MKTITPCLWFDKEAEEAANYYCSIFKNAQLGAITRYGKEGQEVHGKPPGSVLTIEFALDGHKFLASTRARCSSSTRRSRFWSIARRSE